jgi:hypothetical protein
MSISVEKKVLIRLYSSDIKFVGQLISNIYAVIVCVAGTFLS